jgi:hypothetical protein
MTRGIDRRELLKGMGGAAALGSVASGLLGLVGCGPSGDLEAGLVACVADAEAARVVGEAVLLAFGPSPPTAEELVERLAGEQRRAWEARASVDRAQLFEAVRAQHLADFDAGRLFRVRGWLLSETEAQLCALVASRQPAEI